MPEGDVSVQEVEKAGAVLGVANLLLAPFYWADSRWGLFASIGLTSVAVYGLHEIGKERRPVPNAINTANRFFPQGGPPGSEIDNAFKNVVEGGVAVFDQVTEAMRPK